MSRLRVVCNFMSEDFRFTQSVDKCGSPSTRGTYSMLNIRKEHETNLTRSSAARKSDWPTTMTVNWTPFLAPFPLRRPPAKDIFKQSDVDQRVQQKSVFGCCEMANMQRGKDSMYFKTPPIDCSAPMPQSCYSPGFSYGPLVKMYL